MSASTAQEAKQEKKPRAGQIIAAVFIVAMVIVVIIGALTGFGR